MTNERCPEIREVLPELALGVLSGPERAHALEHLAGCGACRAELKQLAEVADELLLLAPSTEPPAGFESRVLAALPPRVSSWRRAWIGLAAASILAAAIGAGAVFAATRDDRRAAQHYRAVLHAAHGTYFEVADVIGIDGHVAGEAFAYEGHPSWMLVSVDGGVDAARFRCDVVTKDGRVLTVGWLDVSGGKGSWGKALPVPLSEVSQLRLVAGDGHPLEASFGTTTD